MDNMKLYEQARSVPTEALKTINAGRLKGMSDINPMWRIKRLTEMFGPCGVGWWYEIIEKTIEYDNITNQAAAFVDILLYYIDPETGTESHGIPGTGGSSFVAQERNGAYMSDECYKMALTDAISVAAKALGIGANVYWDKDSTKYSKTPDKGEKTAENDKKAPLIEIPLEPEITCPVCGKPVQAVTTRNGRTKSAGEVFKALGMCYECYQEQGSMK